MEDMTDIAIRFSDAKKVMFFGYGGNSPLADALRPLIEEIGLSLFTIHEWDTADIKWQRDTWLSHLKTADIIIVPANWKIQPAKSNNRLTQALSLGKPVVCSPLPAYKDVALAFPDAFLFADTDDEWREQLTKLKDDPNLRQNLSKKALEAAQAYSIDAIGQKWLQVLKPAEIVDIIIPTYNNSRGLKLCIDSIRKCTDTPYNLIVVNNGENAEIDSFLKGEKLNYIKTPKSTFAKAINRGLQESKAKYVCLLNDDVIASKGWLKALLEACGPGIGGVGPLSNCDKGWRHNLDILIGGVNLVPGTNTFELIEPILSQIHDFKSPYSDVIPQEWLAYYCVLIPREALDKAGVLNEDYVNSGEDVDHCKRICKQGYRMVQTYKSFLFHFGAVSRKGLEAEDPGSYQAADRKTNDLLKTLWGKPSVMVYSGPAYERWDFRTLETTGIGGSEVWQVWITRELAKLGYRVISFADCPDPGIQEGDVTWMHYTQYDKWVKENWVDYAILSRSTDPLKHPLRAGKVFVQVHDVWLMSAKDQLFLDRVEKFACLSEWHRDFFSDYHKVPRDKIVLTANGIDFARFDSISVERNPYRLHWSSSLDRGLDNVLYLWPFIKEKVPQAELHVFYGVFNWKKSAEQKGDKEALKKIEVIEQGMKQEGVFSHGRVSQKELAMEMKKASLCLAPNWFSETFFITGVELQRAGVPVLANKYAGVITTLGDSAILLGNGDAYWPYTQEGRQAFLNETIKLLTDKEYWKDWSVKGFANSEKYSWEKSTQRWNNLFKGVSE